MAGRKRNNVRSPQMEKDEDYEEKRRRNNEAVNRTREKKRQEETETAKKVEELRVENEKLERQVESLQKELSFLKEMFYAYANGNKKPGDAPSSSSGPPS
ncbi:Basic region leucine zipper [Trichostrongylus colubriformis]|uniref:Basic region leucine zipper n=1 Tax=Trichostrongylus colubriformis TaxID=6319 RepID=A0AAN8IR49_TRICO